MSYVALARKYRPKSFDTLVGQEHVVRALTHALETQRLHHAYLFTGTRGVGKTTLARILAKSLNCETGITAEPCGICNACTAIDADRFVDYIEMDAASNRRVEEMQQLLEQAVYAPSNARFKVYMIDEVHMLTNHAFNAMLKTLEEPPEYVKFILATTDPQKIPVTVLSRCLQFNLKQMPPPQIIGHLENVLQQEAVEFETPALRLLAQGARGSMRDALSLTDQAIAYAGGNVTQETVQSMLGTLDQGYLINLLDALAEKDGSHLMHTADEMAQRSLSYSAALQDLGTLLHRVALAQTVPDALPDDLPERDDIERLAQSFDPNDVQLFYQIAIHGRNDLNLAPDDYAGFTMTLLRMLAFQPEEAGSNTPSPAAKPASAPPRREPAAAPTPKPTRAQSGSPAKAALQAALDKAKNGANGKTAEKKSPEPAPVVTPAPAPASIEEEVKPAELAPAKPVEITAKKIDWDGDWPTLAASLPVRGFEQQLAQQTEMVSWKQNGAGMQIHLRCPIELLGDATYIERLTIALTEHFGAKTSVTTEVGQVKETANQKALDKQAERQREAEEAIHNDPFVQALISEFDATIVPGSIKPAS